MSWAATLHAVCEDGYTRELSDNITSSDHNILATSNIKVSSLIEHVAATFLAAFRVNEFEKTLEYANIITK